MIKLLALDIDGTLVGADYAVTPRLRAALAAAQAQGVHVSLVTGRNWVSTAPYVHDLALPGPHVVFNGSVVTTDGNGGVLHAQPLAWELVDELIVLARRHDLFLELHTMTHCYVERFGEEAAAQRGKLSDPQTLVHFDALDRTLPLLKAQFILTKDRQRRYMYDAEQGLHGAGTLSWGVSPAFYGWFVNVMPPGEDKDNGLEVVLRHLGLAWEEVLAVGDSPADLCFINKAGWGYVMGNASEEVRKKAPNLAPSVRDDGLAQVIEQQVLGAAR